MSLVAGFYWSTVRKHFGSVFYSTRYWNSPLTRLSSLQGSVEHYSGEVGNTGKHNPQVYEYKL